MNLIFFLMFCPALYLFINICSHLMSTLIALEFVALSIFFLLNMMTLPLPNEMFSLLVYISIVVCESALTLSVIILYTRATGNEFLKTNFM